MTRRFREWLIGFAGLVLVLALMPLNSRLIKLDPSVLWVEMGVMGEAKLIARYRNELRKRG